MEYLNVWTVTAAAVTTMVGAVLAVHHLWTRVLHPCFAPVRSVVLSFIRLPAVLDELREVVEGWALESAVNGTRIQLHLAAEHTAEFRFSPEGDLVYANKEMVDLTGRSESQLTGQEWYNAVDPDDRPRFAREIETAIRHRRSMETHVHLANGRHAICRAAPALAGPLTVYVGTLTPSSL